MAKDDADRKLEVAAKYLANPVAAHGVIFAKDHKNRTPAFHEALIRSYHSALEGVIALCFRGSGKSTLAEECIALLVASGQAKNCLIIGDSYQRALDRLRAIRRHLSNNEYLRWLYGPKNELAGDTWQAGRLELQSGSIVWAAGQGMALRGTKYGPERPDFLFCDDLESAETVATPHAREKLSDWFFSDLLPALAPPGSRRIRVAATPLHPESLAVRLSRASEFRSVIIPATFVNEDGNQVSAWPDRFPLTVLDKERESLVRLGKGQAWAQEYMCVAVDPATQLFKREHFKFEPLVRSWEPVFITIDPARTVKKTSATTGIVVASWLGRRIIVWEAAGHRILPSELIAKIFALEERYQPVAIGIERTGLEEFLLQPLRHEQIKRGCFLPLRDLNPPRNKEEFISRAQPLFAAGDVVFAGTEENFPGVAAQFLGFPSGEIDVPNAFAYLPSLRAGQPVYEDCSARHIFSGTLRPFSAFTLAVHAGAFGTAAVLFQYSGGILLIHRDLISSELPGQCLASFVAEARLAASRDVTVVAPAFHFDVANSYGLLAALRGVAAVRKGGDIVRGREFLRELLRSEKGGQPRLLIGEDASFTRRAFCGGFTWEAGKTEPKAGLYRTLMEGLESALAPALAVPQGEQRIAQTPDGTAYKTAEVLRTI